MNFRVTVLTSQRCLMDRITYSPNVYTAVCIFESLKYKFLLMQLQKLRHSDRWMETDLRILQIKAFAWFFTPYEFDPATIQGHHTANLLTVRKKERKVYLKQEMKNEEVRKRGKFKLLEASFSIIKRTFGNFLRSFQRNITNGMSFFSTRSLFPHTPFTIL